MSRIVVVLLCSLLSAAAWGVTQGEAKLDEGMVNPGYHDKPGWFKESFLDLREDVTDANAAGRRLLLYFYQDGCPYCAKLLQENFSDRDIVDKTKTHFDVIAINMWGDREVVGLDGAVTTEKAFARGLSVQFTPTLLFLDEGGGVVLRINGYFAPHKFSTALDYVAQKREQSEDFVTYYGRVRPQAPSGRVHPVAAALPKPVRLGDNRRESHRPLLVLFEQRQCAACDELHTDILTRTEVAYSMTGFDVAQVDMWSDEAVQTPGGKELPARSWAQALNVQYTPSLVFFDGDGKEVFRTEAYLKAFHIHGALDYVATGAYRHQPDFQRYLRLRREELVARGFDVDLMD